MEASKRSVVVWISLLVALVAIVGVVLLFTITSGENRPFGDYILNAQPSEEDTFEQIINESIDINDELSVYAKNLLSGGPPPDGITPIDDPKFVSAAEADLFLTPEDQVFIVTNGEETKIYPQQILVWHEVVNDKSAAQEIAVTYSPLTGSAVAFKADLGTSGLLLNSNSVFYDRQTESLWPQLLGVAIAGDQRGQKLDTVPLVWSTWENAKTVYPEAHVLSRETGFDKSYGFDPYGSYTSESSYYQTGKAFFPVMNEDDRLMEKEVILGLIGDLQDEPLALVKSELMEKKMIQMNFDGQRMTFFWDDELGAPFGYIESLAEMQFTYDDGIFTDQYGGEWNGRGGTTEDVCCLLPTPLSESMWFSWAAFYPETILWNENEISTEPSQVP